MATDNGGSLSFEVKLMLDKLQADVKKANAELAKIGKTATDEGKKIDSAFSGIGKSVASIGAAFSAQQLARQIIQVRGEFEKLEVSFNTMLRSEEKATALMSQLTKTAATTPFGLQDVAGGAKQLLAYGMEAEKINETLIRLGDIAAGLNIPLQDMTYLFGTTMVQGRMYTQDLNQFVGRGIPLIKEFANQFGVAESKVKDLVTEGKIGFPQLQKAIIAMTSEGGQFAGLMEAQSKTIAGQIANLEDAIDMMFNEIGQASEGIISGSIEVVASLVENYEQVGRVLLSLVGVYGVYKTAVIAMTAVYTAQAAGIGALTLAEKLHYTWLVLVEKAQKILNATMLTNPYVLVATAIAGVVAYLVMMKDETELIAEAEAEYNAKLEETARKEEERKQRVKDLIKAAEDESKSTKSRKASLAELERQYPTIFEKYDTEYEKLKNLKQIKLEISEIELSNDIKGIDEQLKENLQRIEDLNEKSEKKVTVTPGLRSTVVVTGGLSREEDAELKMLKNKNKELEKNRELKKQELDDLKNPKKTTNTTTTTTTTNKKAQNQAQKEAERRLKLQQELADDLLQMQQDNEQREIDAMDEGSAKRLAQINHDFEVRRKEIEKQEKDWKKQNIEAGVTTEENGLTKEQSDALANAYAQNVQQQAKAQAELRKEEQQAMRDYLKEYGEYQEKRLAITEDYAERIKNAQNDGERKTLEAERDRALAELELSAENTTSKIAKLFGDMSDLSLKSMKDLYEQGSKFLEFANTKKWDSEKGKIFNISEETFNDIVSTEKLEQLRKIIKRLGIEIEDSEPAYIRLKNAIKDLFDVEDDDLGKKIQKLNDALSEVARAGDLISDTFNSLGELFGSDALNFIGAGMNALTNISKGVASGAQIGMAFGEIGATIGSIIGGVQALASSLASVSNTLEDESIIGSWANASENKKIKQYRKELEVLKESYDDLIESAEEMYSTQAANAYDETIANLEKQRLLLIQIQEQEKNRKTRNEEALRAVERELNDIDDQIEANKEAAVDAIYGEDIQSAIENFADAYVGVWSDGSVKIKDVVRQMMQNMVKESIKATLQSSKAMEEIRQKMREFYADKEFQNWEQQELYKMAEEYQKQLDKDFAWAEDLFKDTTAQQASNGGFQAMSQDTGSELNGRFTTMVELQSLQLDKVRSLAIDTATISQNISEMRNLSLLSIGHLESIAKSNNELYQINSRLGKIEENTSRL